jgi:hypothetical protein
MYAALLLFPSLQVTERLMRKSNNRPEARRDNRVDVTMMSFPDTLGSNSLDESPDQSHSSDKCRRVMAICATSIK